MYSIKGVNGDPLSWLLEADPLNPGVRYFALRDLVGLDLDHPELRAAQELVMSAGPVPVVLNAQNEGGFWERADDTYYPKYNGTVWSLVFLAQVGASGDHPQIRKACEYIFDHNINTYGRFSYNHTPSGSIHCLEGNLIAALIDLGCQDDPRLLEGIEWLARSITGEGIAPSMEKSTPVRYYRSSNCGPGFACSANNFKPCAWGAVKALVALAKVPPERRSPAVQAGLQTGVEFLLSNDPAVADYPTPYDTKPNRSWFQFGYPLFYITDYLQAVEALVLAGSRDDPRLQNALDRIAGKQDSLGRWTMEYTYNGKTWVDIEAKSKPSKWVTLRALRVLNN
jgi:hypothetical protein